MDAETLTAAATLISTLGTAIGLFAKLQQMEKKVDQLLAEKATHDDVRKLAERVYRLERLQPDEAA